MRTILVRIRARDVAVGDWIRDITADKADPEQVVEIYKDGFNQLHFKFANGGEFIYYPAATVEIEVRASYGVIRI